MDQRQICRKVDTILITSLFKTVEQILAGKVFQKEMKARGEEELIFNLNVA